VLGYRLYRDLPRGWRLTSPNLEQSGLLEITYNSLTDTLRRRSRVVDKHPAGRRKPGNARHRGQVLLDDMRRELAIKVDYLSDAAQSASAQ